ncbi:fibrinogen C domain-containing protein 1 isoform X2 [Nematostella vectensis]|uniref:fibrinogen C domain-containing protein 1 isoform X2 n=1 Tax=Nematostella vectensis TaxID=45351 RepID=UPI0020777F53|nr:fibrinogen C domain-containing protein 1 isoform X2 [Nematostella vectensis]
MAYLARLSATTVLLWGVFLHRSTTNAELVQYSEPNTALVDSAYKTIDVANLGECNLKCDGDEKCLSVNYWKVNKKCDLNNATKAMYPEREKKDRTAIYANIREARNCLDVLKAGGKSNGLYTVKPLQGGDAFKVYCDQTTDGGGWTVFQRRQDGSVDFYLGWAYYKRGFGNETGEFWLGLDKIHLLTNQTNTTVRVDLMDWAGATRYAVYDHFAVSAENRNYVLTLGSYSGTAGDSLSIHRGMAFTTKDREHDNFPPDNCAIHKTGAWWYNSCSNSNLNGKYFQGGEALHNGINWSTWKGYEYSLKRSEMKIRPANFVRN